jgi:hypothetical protein
MVKMMMPVAAAAMLMSAGALAQSATQTEPAQTTSPTSATPAPTSTAPAPEAAAPQSAAPAATNAMTAEQPGDMFTTVPGGEKLSSSIVGLDVYNKQNQDVATIKDVAYGSNGVRAYILGVGGLLGMGDTYVAVKPSAVTLDWDNNAKKWHATIDATAEQLKSAPAFTYPSNS